MKWSTLSDFFENESVKYFIKFKSSNKTEIKYMFKANAYKRISKTIRDTYKLNTSVTEAKIKKLPVTDNMKNKMIYYLKNPSKLPSPKTKTKEDKTRKIKKDLIQIMGIGLSLANKLITNGLTDVSQLKQKKYKSMLTDQTKIFLKLKPLKKIPHSFIKTLEPMILQLGKSNTPGTELIIVGSYRRRTNYSSDVDVMVISDNKNTLSKIVDALKLRKDTKVYPYIVGQDKISLILKIHSKTIKLDFFRTPKKEKWAMLLYSTGSKYTNIKMRNKAKRMGMLLNQKGLYKDGKLLSIPSKTKSEKFFFTKLKMPYLEPMKR